MKAVQYLLESFSVVLRARTAGVADADDSGGREGAPLPASTAAEEVIDSESGKKHSSGSGRAVPEAKSKQEIESTNTSIAPAKTKGSYGKHLAEFPQ